MKTKYAKAIRWGIRSARTDIKHWGDDHGSRQLKLALASTLDLRIAGYPKEFIRAYYQTMNNFYKNGGNKK